MSQSKKFLLKGLIVAVTILIADAVIGRLMLHFYAKIGHGEQGRLNYTVDSTVAPVLVLGSSRASHHYVARVMEDSFHMDCYNAGKDKQGLLYDLAILKMVLRRYRPEQLILDLTPTEFRDPAWDELSVLLPYYRKHPEIHSIIDRRASWECLRTQSYLYCYNSLVLQLVFNSVSAERDAAVDKGYIPLEDTLQAVTAFPYADRFLDGPPDTAVTGAFEGLMDLARQEHCRLAIVVSPDYFRLANGSATLQLAKQICADKRVPFFDYSASNFFIGNIALFSDAHHLNKHGAEVFTRLLSHDLLENGFGRKLHS